MLKQICSYNSSNLIQSFNLLQRLRLTYSTSTSVSSSINEKGNNHDHSFAKFLVDSLNYTNHESLTISAKFLKWRPKEESLSNEIDSNFVQNANSVIDFFKQLGFQQSQIREIISSYPRYLCSKVDKTLKPKIEALSELGLSGCSLIQAILRNPSLLCRDLVTLIHALRRVLGSDTDVVVALTRRASYMSGIVIQNLIINVEFMESCYGIPRGEIRKFVLYRPATCAVDTDVFREALSKVEQKLGIPRRSSMFLYGVCVMVLNNKEKIDAKFRVFESFGWTCSDLQDLCKWNPMCLTSSVARLKKRLGFLMEEVGYKANELSRLPLLFTYSLEKRLLPRYRVLQVLKEKGLCRVDYSLAPAACMSNSVFLKRFVLPFADVHDVYAQLTGGKVGSHTADSERSTVNMISDSDATRPK